MNFVVGNTITRHFLQKAVEVHDHLSYTSIKDGISKTLVNETKSKYVGEVFEGGLLHFFKAYSYLQIYLNKNIKAYDGDNFLPPRDKRQITNSNLKTYLQKARSEIVAWNSYLEKLNITGLEKVSLNKICSACFWRFYSRADEYKL